MVLPLAQSQLTKATLKLKSIPRKFLTKSIKFVFFERMIHRVGL